MCSHLLKSWFWLLCLGASHGAEAPKLLGYDTLPLGSLEEPLVLRSFFPDPELDPVVFAHHHRSAAATKYAPTTGQDISGEVPPIPGIPDAFGVNFGPELSYVFDTTEGRLLFAWKGGFVDLFPYWGDEALGTRKAYDYLPRLVGTLFYKAAGLHPVEIAGRSLSQLGRPQFLGYDLVGRNPTFIVRFGDFTLRTKVGVLPNQLGLTIEIASEPAAPLSYRIENAGLGLTQKTPRDGLLRVTLTGTAIAHFSGYSRQLKITEATTATGEMLYRSYGCVGCHSTDGAAGHGPTLAGLFQRQRILADGAVIQADEEYLLESIKSPNAKIADGFGPNLMPAFPLKDVEADSLVRFIKSLPPPN